MLASALLLFPSIAAAQPDGASAQGHASAEVVEALVVTAAEDLRFGEIAGSASQPGTVTVDPDGSTVFAGGARSVCSGAAVCASGAALFAVKGTGGRSYLIAFPAQIIARSGGGGAELQVRDLTAASANNPVGGSTGLLDAAGEDEVRIGGTLEIPPATAPGNYSAEVPIVVSYG